MTEPLGTYCLVYPWEHEIIEANPRVKSMLLHMFDEIVVSQKLPVSTQDYESRIA